MHIKAMNAKARADMKAKGLKVRTADGEGDDQTGADMEDAVETWSAQQKKVAKAKHDKLIVDQVAMSTATQRASAGPRRREHQDTPERNTSARVSGEQLGPIPAFPSAALAVPKEGGGQP
jgi:hypothetical protein